MAKTVQVGPLTLGVAAAAGEVKLTAVAQFQEALGGGKAAGVASVKGGVNIEADLGAQQAADLVVLLLEAHFPSATTILEGAKGLMDAGIAKVTI